jgi:hypothetical protein
MEFISKHNSNLLWEILSDEPIIKNTSKAKQDLVYEAFNTNLLYFYEKEKNTNSNNSLVSLNKRFLSQMLKVLRNDVRQPTQQTNQTKQLYKAEDIQAQRQQMFDHELSLKRNEFESSIMREKPPVPDFTEKIEDEKIKGMDELIARTIAQRNFDISQINTPIINEKWLKPQDTSSRANKNGNTQNMQTNQEMRYIKIEDSVPAQIIKNDIIDLSIPDFTSNSSKKISWNNHDEIKYFEENDIVENNDNPDIFSKLKKIVIPEALNDDLENIKQEKIEKIEKIGNNEPIENNNQIIQKLLEDYALLKQRLEQLENEIQLLKEK